jgi:hypothetical protein
MVGIARLAEEKRLEEDRSAPGALNAVREIVRGSHFTQRLAETLRLGSSDRDLLPVAPVFGGFVKTQNARNRAGAHLGKLPHALVEKSRELVRGD